jgi:hypothetical protein
MTYPRLLGTVAVAFGLLSAQQPVEDPVMKIKAQRAQAGGDQDLPPVPRTVMEPPPLPAPELHVKDTRGYRAKGKKGKAATGKKSVSKVGRAKGAKKGPSVKK